jgi:hypothetical protein
MGLEGVKGEHDMAARQKTTIEIANLFMSTPPPLRSGIYLKFGINTRAFRSSWNLSPSDFPISPALIPRGEYASPNRDDLFRRESNPAMKAPFSQASSTYAWIDLRGAGQVKPPHKIDTSSITFVLELA